MTEMVKTGVFGVGSLGQWHARIYSELEDADLVGVYDLDPARAAEIAERYHTRPFLDMAELAQQIDAASVVVPTDKHFAVFEALLPYNLHLLMEKPLASSTHEAEEMVRMAQNRVADYPNRYVDYIYGQDEVGGTEWLYLSAAPFEQIGFRTDLSHESVPALTQNFLYAVPVVFLLWPAFLNGMRYTKLADPDEQVDHRENPGEES